MISCIEGAIVFKGDRFVVIDTGGVGYKVFAPPETLRILPQLGERTRLWTHLHVREDSLELYGFLHYAEMDFFESLISVSGIGPKSAVGILGVAPLDSLKKAIAAGETVYLTKVSGVGRKTAEKIVLELKDKLGAGSISEVVGAEIREEGDILEALTSMGYSIREVREALQHIPADISGTEKRLNEALKIMGQGKKHA